MVAGSPAGNQPDGAPRRDGRIDSALPNVRLHPDLAELERLRASVGALQQENRTLRLLIAIHDRLGALVLQRVGVASIMPRSSPDREEFARDESGSERRNSPGQ